MNRNRLLRLPRRVRSGTVGDRADFHSGIEGHARAQASPRARARVHGRRPRGPVRDSDRRGVRRGYPQGEATVLTNAAGEYRIRAELPRARGALPSRSPRPPPDSRMPRCGTRPRHAGRAPTPTLDFQLVPGQFRSASGSWTRPGSLRSGSRCNSRGIAEEAGSLCRFRASPRNATGHERGRDLLVHEGGRGRMGGRGSPLGCQPGTPREVPRPARGTSAATSVEVVLHPKAVGRASVIAEIVDEATGQPVAPVAVLLLCRLRLRTGDWSRRSPARDQRSAASPRAMCRPANGSSW